MKSAAKIAVLILLLLGCGTEMQALEGAPPLRRLAKVIPDRGGTFPFVYGHAVVFLFADLRDVDLPLAANERIVFGAEDLDGLKDRILDARRFWRAERQPSTPLTPPDFKRFRRLALHPAPKLAPSLAVRLRTEGEQLVRLSEQQVAVMRGFLTSRRLRVAGGAGTGKRVLALKLVRMHATEGRGVLLCFNRALARHLDQPVADLEDVEGKVPARSFHQLCHQAFGALGCLRQRRLAGVALTRHRRTDQPNPERRAH